MTMGTDVATTFRLHHPGVLLYAPFHPRPLVWCINTRATNAVTLNRNVAAIVTIGKTRGTATMNADKRTVFR